MKYLSLFTLILFVGFFVVATPAVAATTVRTGQTISITEQQVVEGDFYAIANSVVMSGTVNGDMQILAGNATLNGVIANDVLILGGTAAVHATVEGDVRVVAGDVTIASAVSGNIAVLSGRLTVLSTATVGGDILFYGGEATIEGKVEGKVLGNSDGLRIDGVVKGGVNVTARALTLGDQVDIAGDVQYVSSNELVRAPGAIVEGSVVRNDNQIVASTSFPIKKLLISFLVSLFATLSLYLVLRRPLEQFAIGSVRSFGLKALIGFATIILAPIAISILLISVLGFFVGLIGLFMFLLGLVITLPLMNVVSAAMLSKLFKKKSQINVVWITIGALLVQTLLFIPIVGLLAFVILMLGTLGGVVLLLYKRFR